MPLYFDCAYHILRSETVELTFKRVFLAVICQTLLVIPVDPFLNTARLYETRHPKKVEDFAKLR